MSIHHHIMIQVTPATMTRQDQQVTGALTQPEGCANE